MRSIKEVTKELGQGKSIVVSGKKDNKMMVYEATISNSKEKENIRVLEIFQNCINILEEIKNGSSFKLCYDKETLRYKSSMYNHDDEVYFYEDFYPLDSIYKLEENIKQDKKLIKKVS